MREFIIPDGDTLEDCFEDTDAYMDFGDEYNQCIVIRTRSGEPSERIEFWKEDELQDYMKKNQLDGYIALAFDVMKKINHECTVKVEDAEWNYWEDTGMGEWFDSIVTYVKATGSVKEGKFIGTVEFEDVDD